MSKGRGSLSTILAGALVLIALLMGIGIAITVLSTIITLENMAANHVNEVGRAAATYSGLITQGNTLISTKGPVTIIGAITPSDFKTINMTTYEYISNATEPVLLLTNVGPVILDPQQDTNNPALSANPINYYLWHWVTAVITTAKGQGQYTGVIIMLNNNPYLFYIDQPTLAINKPSYAAYIVGPLNGYNTYVTKDYGAGPAACQALYTISAYPGTYDTCPAPPPGPISTSVYTGYWPKVSISPISNTAVEVTITFLAGTTFNNWYNGGPAPPQSFTLYVLSQDSATWLNPTCQGTYVINPGTCTFSMANLTYSYNGNAYYLKQSVTYDIIINMNQPVPSNYYLIMFIPLYGTSYQGAIYAPEWFVWNITSTNTDYPTWLDTPGQPATVETPS